MVRVTNVTEATRTVTLYAVPSSGSASDTNAIVKNFAVPSNDYVLVSVPYLEDGDTLQGKADQASALNIQFEKGDSYTG